MKKESIDLFKKLYLEHKDLYDFFTTPVKTTDYFIIILKNMSQKCRF